MTPGSLIATATVLAAACGAGERPASQRDSTVTVLYDGSNEWLFGPSHDDSPKFLVFQPLVTYRTGSCGDIVGGLAEHWEHSPDWRTWTVRLRPGVRWHDGAPVTAEDVAHSIRLWKHPDVSWYGAAAVRTVEVVDDRTLRFELARPGRWPLDGWDVFYPRHLLEKLEPREFMTWSFWTQPVGNGPFRYVRHVPETMVELAANDEYYGGRPRIGRVIVQFAQGGGSGAVELLAGNVDLVVGLSPSEAIRIARDPRFVLYHTRQAASTWILWNYTRPQFSEVRVRQALSHALDRAALAAALDLPAGTPMTDAPYHPCQLERLRFTPPRSHDPARARVLLAEAGWTDRNGDGVVDRGGVPLRFELVVVERDNRAAVLVQEHLRRIGVAMDVRVLDQSVVHQRFRAGDFEAIIAPTVGANQLVASSRSPLGVLDHDLAALIAQATAEPDPERQVALYEAFGPRYRDLVPATFLYLRHGTLVAHRRIKGLGEPGSVILEQGWRWPFGPIETAWIEER